MFKLYVLASMFRGPRTVDRKPRPSPKRRARPRGAILDPLEARRLLSATQSTLLAPTLLAESSAQHATLTPTAAKQTPVKAAAKAKPNKTVYKPPITITVGGTYSGNWQSDDPNVPAVSIRTSEPVIIQNSTIISRGTLIDVIGYAANVTVRHTRGYALNPNVLGRYPGRFMDVEGFVSVLAYNNYLQGTSGIYLYNYLGNHTRQQTVRILRNKARNIDGRFSDGKGGSLTGHDDNYYVQFFQINGVQDLVNAEVAWNEIVNEPGKSRVEENINIHDSSGTPASPFSIHDNYVQGAYPADVVNDTHYRGGGIMLSDNGSSHIRAYRNQVVATTNQGMTIASGHDNAFFNNRILSSGILPNGQVNLAQNVGAIIWNFNNETTFTNNVGYNNYIGWMLNGDQNNAFIPDASVWKNNKDYRGVVTRQVELAEWRLWLAKLAKSRIKVGV